MNEQKYFKKGTVKKTTTYALNRELQVSNFVSEEKIQVLLPETILCKMLHPEGNLPILRKRLVKSASKNQQNNSQQMLMNKSQSAQAIMSLHELLKADPTMEMLENSELVT
jgi:hypothetical protein